VSLQIPVKELIQKPGTMKEVQIVHELEHALGTETIAVPKGRELSLDIRLESVHEGILVTVSGDTLADSECSRCLEPMQEDVEIELQELFHYQPQEEDDFAIVQDRVDLEQALIDAVVPNLPLKPLCSENCPGLCADCGERADLGTHNHEKPIDPRFGALKDFGS
jgi:uncharacterized protein